MFFISLGSNSSSFWIKYLPVLLSSFLRNDPPWRTVCRPLLHPPGKTTLVLQRRAKNEIWIFRLLSDPSHAQLVPPSPGTHRHTSAPAVPGPRGGCHSAHRTWGSCSCRLWSGGACRSWTSPCGTARQKPGSKPTLISTSTLCGKTNVYHRSWFVHCPLILGYDCQLTESVYQAHKPKFWSITAIQRELGHFIHGLDQRTACASFTSPNAQRENIGTLKIIHLILQWMSTFAVMNHSMEEPVVIILVWKVMTKLVASTLEMSEKWEQSHL